MSAQPPPLPPGSPRELKPGVMPLPEPALPRPTPPPLPPNPRTEQKAHEPRPAPPALGRQFLDEEELARFKNLLVFARTTVESRFAGRHKSQDLGAGGEFREYKQYHEGLPVSSIDWHVFARTRRLFIRTYEELSDMAVHLVVDLSGSMSFRAKGEETKALRAARLAATLAYLMLRQGDKASLTIFADRILHHIPVGGTERHLLQVTNALVKPAFRPEGPTRIADSLRETSTLLKRRGRLVVLSDFLGEDPDDILDALGPFVHRRFEALLLQLADPEERTLPSAPLARFVDAETGEELEVEPDEIREAFEEKVAERTEALRIGCQRRRIDFARLDTDQPYLDAIEAYLGFRQWEDLAR